MSYSLDSNTFIYYKNEINTKSQLGVLENKIVEIPNFVDADIAEKLIEYFENGPESWEPIAFYGSYGMGLNPDAEELKKFDLDSKVFEIINSKTKAAVEIIFNIEVKPNTSHAQKWVEGGFAYPHSDNSDFDGNPTAFEINKYVAILYLNDDYTGGILHFPDHNLSIKPNKYSIYIMPGGIENIHEVREILSGERHTMLSFWDFADSTYSEERKLQWEKELEEVRASQAEQREEWKNGNKYA
jgi:hypothetical protein